MGGLGLGGGGGGRGGGGLLCKARPHLLSLEIVQLVNVTCSYLGEGGGGGLGLGGGGASNVATITASIPSKRQWESTSELAPCCPVLHSIFFLTAVFIRTDGKSYFTLHSSRVYGSLDLQLNLISIGNCGRKTNILLVFQDTGPVFEQWLRG